MKHIFQTLLVTLSLASACVANAQLTIKPVELYEDGDLTHRFPVLTEPSPVAQEINCFLQQTVLGYETCLQGEDVLVRDLLSPNGLGGLIALNYQQLPSPEGIVSFLFIGEFLGAYSTEWENIYHFNVHDGSQIVMSDLLDSNGLVIVGMKVFGDLLVHDATYLEQFTQENLNDPDEFETSVSLYAQCVQDRMGMAVRADDDYKRSTYLLSGEQRFTLKEFQIETECNFVHAAQAYQNAGATLSVFSYESLRPYLNDYGVCLLIEQRSDCQL